MLIGAQAFMRLVALFRSVWVRGRRGGGKTALSLFMAQWLVEHQWAARVASNIPIVGAIQPHQFPIPFEDVAVILDEAALYLDNWQVAKKYLAFSRKYNQFIIMPSVWPVSPRLRFLSCERVFNCYVVGLPAWIYRWNLDTGGSRDKGYFSLFKPDRAFGMYNTEGTPSDDGGLASAIAATMRHHGFKEGRLGLDTGENNMNDGFADVAEALEGFGVHSERFERAAKKLKR